MAGRNLKQEINSENEPWDVLEFMFYLICFPMFIQVLKYTVLPLRMRGQVGRLPWHTLLLKGGALFWQQTSSVAEKIILHHPSICLVPWMKSHPQKLLFVLEEVPSFRHLGSCWQVPTMKARPSSQLTWVRRNQDLQVVSVWVFIHGTVHYIDSLINFWYQ